MFVCAVSDTATFLMWGVNLLASIVMGAFMYSLNTRTRHIENLEGDLAETAEKLVQSQIAAKTGELTGAMKELSGEIKRINQRLDDGDGSIDKLGERNQRIELAMANQTKELTTFLMQNFATKDDVAHLASRVEGLADHVRGVELDGVKAAAAATVAAIKKGGA